MKLLVALDFDQTIIQFNSDTVIEKLIPKEIITEELKKLRSGPLWLDYMQEIFNILHRNNVSKDQILKVCGECDSTDGMIDLLKALKSSLEADIIIISDSNSVFIDHWLKCNRISDLVDQVYTNPGNFNADGLLEVKMYHMQDWCKLSTQNLCKGHVLEKHLEEQEKKGVRYDVVAYVGDGRNDICPLMKLRETDVGFPRVGYTLNKILRENNEIRSQIQASIHPWTSGQEILSVIQKQCEK